MTAAAVQRLSALTTEPYRRGAETLAIEAAAEVDGSFELPAYDFAEYRARHGGEPPAPRYVLRALEPSGPDPVRVEVDLDTGGGGGTETVTVTLPARSLVGTSLAIPLPPDAGPELRVLRLRRLDAGPARWTVLALLGNLAKLLWVIGAEQDLLRAGLDETAAQRELARARSASLDLLGADLRVPRFPPRPYSFDVDTVALYHFDEHPLSDLDPFADETSRFGLAGHPGVVHGAASGAIGKFGRGFELPGDQPDGHLRIAHHADFNVGAADSFTVELFVRLEPATGDEVRAVVIKGNLNAGGDLAGRGWALTTGSFRGVPDNLRWAGSDGGGGGGGFELFADETLADGTFHHLAGIVDRQAGRSRLFVDGVERAGTDIDALGTLGNNNMVRVGRSPAGHQLAAAIDELRFTRAARREFDPVLGEGDSAYRRRLAIFERWRLPTAGELLAAINEEASIDGMTDPFVIVEHDRPSALSSRLLRILPTSVPTGSHLDRDGYPRSSVEELCGRAADEPGLPPELLLSHQRQGVRYADANARRMQVGIALRLEALRELLDREGEAGDLRVERSYDPEAAVEPGTDLHRVGRALSLHHPGLAPDRLAALAHEAGFDFVETRSASVFAAAAPGPLLEIVLTSASAGPEGVDAFEGDRLELTTRPTGLPAAGRFSWSIVPCGVGRGELAAHPDDAPDDRRRIENRPRLSLEARTAGELVVAAEFRYSGITVTGARRFRIAPPALAVGEGIAADGSRAADVSTAAGEPEDDFDPRYLVEHDSGVRFAGGVDPSMQIALDRRLRVLVELLADVGPASGLQVAAGFDPAADDLRSVGRALTCRHAGLDGGRLAQLAHIAGFAWTERISGAEVLCAEAAGERVEIVAADGTPAPDALPAGTVTDLALRPETLADGSFNWSLDDVGRGRARMLPVLRRETALTAVEPGLVAVNALFLARDPHATAPYTLEVRLRPELDRPEVILPKEQYDRVMNILNHFHPIGVEVVTRNLREHVVEVRDDLLNAFPGYTYPEFRA